MLDLLYLRSAYDTVVPLFQRVGEVGVTLGVCGSAVRTLGYIQLGAGADVAPETVFDMACSYLAADVACRLICRRVTNLF